jgi:hypothetical protein
VAPMADQLLLTEATSLAPSVPCDFCSGRIPATSFDYVHWSADKRLLAAHCPCCHQRTIMSIKLWRRHAGMSVPSLD